jgi:hypothetical protein
MRKIILILPLLLAAACSSGDDGPVAECSIEGQKQFVVDAMRAWYFWNDRLPAEVDLGQFATPDDLLAYLMTFSPDLTPNDGLDNPVDRFSFINTAAGDQAFFGEGRFEGFGFSSRFVADNDLRGASRSLHSTAARSQRSRQPKVSTRCSTCRRWNSPCANPTAVSSPWR